MNNQTVIHPEVARVIVTVLDAHGIPPREREQAVAERGSPRVTGLAVHVSEDTDEDDGDREVSFLFFAHLGDGATAAETARALELTEAEARARLREVRTRFFRRLAAIERVMASVLGEVEGLAVGEDEPALEDEEEGR